MAEDLDRLAAMLKIIQANEPKSPESETESGSKKYGNSGMTRDEISAKAYKAEEAAKADPAYEFTHNVMGQALADMLPLVLGNESPFDTLMEQMGMSAFLVKKHLAETLVSALKALPEKTLEVLMEDMGSGRMFVSMLCYTFTEAVFIAAAAKKVAQGIEGHPLNEN